MKKIVGVSALAVIMGLTGWGFAVDAVKCTSSTQDCLNYMTRNLESRGWVGIEVDDERGIDEMVVTEVVKGSPADKAGFSKGDLLIAVNGVVFAESNKKKIRDIQYSMQAGDEVTYLVGRRRLKKELRLEATSLPDSVKAQRIGEHMMGHAEVQGASASVE